MCSWIYTMDFFVCFFHFSGDCRTLPWAKLWLFHESVTYNLIKFNFREILASSHFAKAGPSKCRSIVLSLKAPCFKIRFILKFNKFFLKPITSLILWKRNKIIKISQIPKYQNFLIHGNSIHTKHISQPYTSLYTVHKKLNNYIQYVCYIQPCLLAAARSHTMTVSIQYTQFFSLSGGLICLVALCLPFVSCAVVFHFSLICQCFHSHTIFTA